ncbi:uncharacterized protein KY384_000624 [Bacidia gigantensis]|uniref:uncharacterized protein n=1 Tax=Bacidia gigantensis TaxID=2732470 RepID=UPI001D043129|nr:uncharacterized protein KY384_000624 [Bacidia gigantensis]KAG8525864.1 hypothetical protein KY384_000624 [Bacidia gigantensis]
MYDQPTLDFPTGDYSNVEAPNFAYQQHNSRVFLQTQVPPSEDLPFRGSSLEMDRTDAQDLLLHKQSGQLSQPAYMVSDDSLAYNPQNPTMLPLSSTLAGPQASWTQKSVAQPTMSSFQPTLPSAALGASATLRDLGANKKSMPPSKGSSDLEDGQVSSGEVSEEEHQPESGIINGYISRTSHPDDGETGRRQSLIESRVIVGRLVQELYTWGLDLQDMLGEVTNPGALRMFFEELGLPISNASQVDSDIQKPAAFEGADSQSSRSRPELSTSIPRATEGVLANLSTAQTPFNSVESQNTQASNPNQGANRSTPMDRKALIAQKLAAKSSKGFSSSTNSGIQATKTGDTQEVPQAKVFGQAGLSTFQIGAEGESDNVPQKPITEGFSDLEARRKAQTELARKRLEALKHKAAAKDHSEGPNSSKALVQLPLPPDKSIQKDFDSVAASPNTPIVQHVGQTSARRLSYFSPVAQSPAFNIPGLFSAAQNSYTELPLNGVNSDKNEIAPAATTPAPDLQALSVPVEEMESVGMQYTQGPHSLQRSVEPPQKRQKASDFLESPLSGPARSQPRDDGGVIIDISDDESDQSHQYLDVPDVERTDTSVQDVDQIGEPLPFTGTLSPEKEPSSIHTQALPLALPAHKNQDTKGLKSKEMEIESMNRKIAELEANIRARKAKQIVSRPSSPSSTAQDSSDISRLITTKKLVLKENQLQSDTAPRQNDPNEEHQRRSPVSTQAPISRAISEVECGFKQVRSISGSIAPLLEEEMGPSEMILGQELGHSQNSQVPTGVAYRPTPKELDQFPNGQLDLEARKVSRRAEIESGLPILNEEIEKVRLKLRSLKKQESELEAEIQRGVEGRRLLLEELKRLSQVADAMQITDEPEMSFEGIESRRAPSAVEGQIIDKELPMPGDDQEFQISDKILQNSDTEEGVALNGEAGQLNIGHPRVSGDSGFDRASQSNFQHHDKQDEDVMDISRSDIDEGEITDGASQSHNDEADTNWFEMGLESAQNAAHQQSSKDSEGGRWFDSADNESRTSEFTNDVSDSKRQFDPTEEVEDMEDEMAYEPPNDFMAIDLDPNSYTTNGEAGTNRVDGSDSNEEGKSMSNANATSISPSRQMMGDGSAQTERQPSSANEPSPPNVDEDSDADYEPPEPPNASDIAFTEPQSLASHAQSPLNSSPGAHEKDANEDNNLSKEVTDYKQNPLPTNIQQESRFVPYESLLKQFKSYRSNPEYIHEFPGGV